MKKINPKSTWLFFIIAFGLSWLFWIPAAFVEENVLESSWVILLYLGGLGPPVAGIALTYLNKDKSYQKEYWQRVLNPKRIGGKWYLVILLGYPILAFLVALILNGQIQLSETLKDLLEQPLSLITFAIFIFIFGPLPEELGWRGYVLDELQEQMNAVVSSIVLGAMWAIWHLPLFFMKGTYQNEMGFGTFSFWQFCVSAVVFSVLITWVYNNNRRSTLSAALLHFIVNLTGNLIDISVIEELTRNILLLIITIIIIQIYGVNTLQGKKTKKEVVAT
jgi:membrane protease YdiL (CAAX protease family)